jgi:hypothetical protein
MGAVVAQPTNVRAALHGVGAAAAWLAVEPLACRLVRTPLTTPRLLGAVLVRGPAWLPVGVGLHLVNGALVGLAFRRLAIRGWRQGLLVAQVEGVLLWPAMFVVDRVHPDRRDGTWPPLATSGRAFAKEAIVHGVFGAALGALAQRLP